MKTWPFPTQLCSLWALGWGAAFKTVSPSGTIPVQGLELGTYPVLCCHHKGWHRAVFMNPSSWAQELSFKRKKKVAQRWAFLLLFLHLSHFYWTGGTSCKTGQWGDRERFLCLKEDGGLRKDIFCVWVSPVRANAPTFNSLHLLETEVLGKLEEHCMTRS